MEGLSDQFDRYPRTYWLYRWGSALFARTGWRCGSFWRRAGCRTAKWNGLAPGWSLQRSPYLFREQVGPYGSFLQLFHRYHPRKTRSESAANADPNWLRIRFQRRYWPSGYESDFLEGWYGFRTGDRGRSSRYAWRSQCSAGHFGWACGWAGWRSGGQIPGRRWDQRSGVESRYP